MSTALTFHFNNSNASRLPSVSGTLYLGGGLVQGGTGGTGGTTRLLCLLLSPLYEIASVEFLAIGASSVTEDSCSRWHDMERSSLSTVLTRAPADATLVVSAPKTSSPRTNPSPSTAAVSSSASPTSTRGEGGFLTLNMGVDSSSADPHSACSSPTSPASPLGLAHTSDGVASATQGRRQGFLRLGGRRAPPQSSEAPKVEAGKQPTGHASPPPAATDGTTTTLVRDVERAWGVQAWVISFPLSYAIDGDAAARFDGIRACRVHYRQIPSVVENALAPLISGGGSSSMLLAGDALYRARCAPWLAWVTAGGKGYVLEAAPTAAHVGSVTVESCSPSTHVEACVLGASLPCTESNLRVLFMPRANMNSKKNEEGVQSRPYPFYLNKVSQAPVVSQVGQWRMYTPHSDVTVLTPTTTRAKGAASVGPVRYYYVGVDYGQYANAFHSLLLSELSHHERGGSEEGGRQAGGIMDVVVVGQASESLAMRRGAYATTHALVVSYDVISSAMAHKSDCAGMDGAPRYLATTSITAAMVEMGMRRAVASVPQLKTVNADCTDFIISSLSLAIAFHRSAFNETDSGEPRAVAGAMLRQVLQTTVKVASEPGAVTSEAVCSAQRLLLLRRYAETVQLATWLLSVPLVKKMLSGPNSQLHVLELLLAGTLQSGASDGHPPVIARPLLADATAALMDRVVPPSSSSLAMPRAMLARGDLSAEVTTTTAATASPAFLDVTLKLRSLHARNTLSAVTGTIPISCLVLVFVCDAKGASMTQATPLTWNVSADQLLRGQHQRTTVAVQNDWELRRSLLTLYPLSTQRRRRAAAQHGDGAPPASRGRRKEEPSATTAEEAGPSLFLELDLRGGASPAAGRKRRRATAGANTAAAAAGAASVGAADSHVAAAVYTTLPLLVLDADRMSPLTSMTVSYEHNFWMADHYTAVCSARYALGAIVASEAFSSLFNRLHDKYLKLQREGSMLSDELEDIKMTLHGVCKDSICVYRTLLPALLLDGCSESPPSTRRHDGQRRLSTLREVLDPSAMRTTVEELLSAIEQRLRACAAEDADCSAIIESFPFGAAVDAGVLLHQRISAYVFSLEARWRSDASLGGATQVLRALLDEMGYRREAQPRLVVTLEEQRVASAVHALRDGGSTRPQCSAPTAASPSSSPSSPGGTRIRFRLLRPTAAASSTTNDDTNRANIKQSSPAVDGHPPAGALSSLRAAVQSSISSAAPVQQAAAHSLLLPVELLNVSGTAARN